jgi:tRNA pseudouridine38-40 synthase
MPRYKLIIAYDGTRFHGFQRQLTNHDVSGSAACNKNDSYRPPPKRPHWLASGQKKPCHQTIQQVLEQAMMSWTGVSDVQILQLAFASRTDKGVHAKGQVVAVTLPNREYDFCEIVNCVNSRLPWDISVESAIRCDESFDPRANVFRKQYSYTIKYRRKMHVPIGTTSSGKLGPHSFRSAIDPPCLWHVPWSLKDSQLIDLCAFLQGNHDFAAFVHKEDRHAKCQVLSLDKMTFEIISESNNDTISSVVVGRFVLESAGFRRSMVRNLVGFCIDICRDCETVKDWDWKNELWKLSPDEAGQRIHAAPASGLCLEFIEYHTNNDSSSN